jgi:hypothetical protein
MEVGQGPNWGCSAKWKKKITVPHVKYVVYAVNRPVR